MDEGQGASRLTSESCPLAEGEPEANPRREQPRRWGRRSRPVRTRHIQIDGFHTTTSPASPVQPQQPSSSPVASREVQGDYLKLYEAREMQETTP